MDLREYIRRQPMGRFQIRTIGICFALCVLDGFEILMMPFIAPFLAEDWGLTPVHLGYLLSASIVGSAAGAILVSPMADRIGRRKLAILCLAGITTGMLLSAVAADVPQMVAVRIFTGLGLGGIVSNLNVLVSEYSSDRRRGTALGIYGTGLPLGSALGGVLTTILCATYGWRSVFVIAAALTAVLLVVVVKWLPESVDYLVDRHPHDAKRRYNVIAQRLGASAVDTLPPPSLKPQHPVRDNIFRGTMLLRTIYLWGGYSLLVAAFYFANTWTPKLVTDATGDVRVGATAGVLVSVGGVIGALLFAALAALIRPRPATVMMMVLGAVSYLCFANSFDVTAATLILTVLVGIAANGGMASFYAISPSVYPAVSRATGVGWMVGCGRSVAIAAPILTGYLIERGWEPSALFTLFGSTLLISGLAVWLLDRTFAPTVPSIRPKQSAAQ